MEIVTGIFKERTRSERVVDELRAAGFSKDRIGFLTPGTSERKIERTVPITDSERPGMGTAMGAAVGGAIGAASGASLGAAAASLLVPGVGPVIAVGLLGAALLGTAGVVTGAVTGETLEEALGEGLPHEELYVYEEALRRGHSVVLAYADDSDFADRAREIMERNGGLDFNSVRESWWDKLRDDERKQYQTSGRDFDRDEVSYRRGFQAALHSKRRGKSYPQAEAELRDAYDDSQLDTAFRLGYERGLRYQTTVTERYKV
jgi:hypothetical protein